MLTGKVAKTRRKINYTFTGYWSPSWRKFELPDSGEEEEAAYRHALALLTSPRATLDDIKEALQVSLRLGETTERKKIDTDNVPAAYLDSQLFLLAHAAVTLTQFACESFIPTTTK